MNCLSNGELSLIIFASAIFGALTLVVALIFRNA